MRFKVEIRLDDGQRYSVGPGGTFDEREMFILQAKRDQGRKPSREMVNAILRVKRHLGGKVVR